MMAQRVKCWPTIDQQLCQHRVKFEMTAVCVKIEDAGIARGRGGGVNRTILLYVIVIDRSIIADMTNPLNAISAEIRIFILFMED